jgi:ATP-binding cassette subfamily B protein
VQALSLEAALEQAFSSQNAKNLSEGVKGKQLAAGLGRTVDVLTAVGTAFVLWYGARLVLSGVLTPGELLVFIAYLKNAFKPMRDLAKYTGRIAQATASGERVLDVHPGQQVALVGPSGSGKSTLVSLLLRLYDPQEGRVMIDGRDIRDYTLESLRTQIGIVLQESMLFAVSTRDNIAYGWLNATDAEIKAAARLANAHDFITALPEGYDTILGERGATLSGGERQRIAIARAAVRRAPLLVFDEPTTGLDRENERVVSEALERLTEGRTTFLIAHNLRTVEQADLILYLERGRIVERGTHAELMRANGRYAAMYALQASSLDTAALN